MPVRIHNKEEEILLCDITGLERIDLYTRDLSLNSGQQKRFNEALKKRTDGIPLQYIMGKTEFYGLPIIVESGVFIPRPETEILVETVLNLLNHRPSTNDYRPLDLCTGSGNIAIVLAKYAKCGKIIATDISEKALETARKNAVLNSVAEKIDFKKADLFEGINRKTCPESLDFARDGSRNGEPVEPLVEGFDIIVCNPPYIKKEYLKSLPREVSYDPVTALDGGEDGLDFYRKIVNPAPQFLKDNGILVLELGDGQAEDVKNMFSGGTKIIKDLNKIERVLIWTK